MAIVAIPAWNAQGIIEPLDAANPTDVKRSPYAVSLIELQRRFGASAERLLILSGFLKYRSVLHEAGLIKGFQWLDGSFLENIEALESRPPQDLDVVTFYHLPLNETQKSISQKFADIFNSTSTKRNYKIDAYGVCLKGAGEPLANKSAYWYSMWAHRRDRVWKGYLQVDLNPESDADAKKALDSLTAAKGQP
jgi:hypothetical protein